VKITYTNQRDITRDPPSPNRLRGSATVRLAVTAGRAKLRFISLVDNLGVQDVLVPELSDGVVLLRPLSWSDAQDHLAGEDEELVRWLNGGPGTVDTVASHIATAQDMWLAGGPTFSFAIRSALDDRLAGTIDVQLKSDHAPRGFANLAYGLYAPYRRRGWASRAVELAVRFLRRRDDTTDVLIRVEAANSASIAVANRAGFSVYAEPPDTPDAHIWYRRSLSEGGPQRRHQPIAER
jgi:RimJ/RimL family protein N-acetyltransferase